MSQSRKSSRRAFLRGRSALEALEEWGDRSLGGASADEANREAASRRESPEEKRSPAARDVPSYLVEIGRRAMACDFQINLNAGEHPHGPQAALEALDLVDRLEDQMTVYRNHSEVCAINRRAAREPVRVELHLFYLLRRAQILAEETGGAFDLTAGPLVKLWGFYRREGRLPDEADLRRAQQNVGWRHVELDEEKTAIRFRREGVEINLGAIGKGYALDRAARLLLDAGVENFLFHGGRSSLIAYGSRRGAGEAGGWRVAIRHPLRPDRPVGEIRVRDRGLGTSGSATQFFTHRGRRYGHILDPRTGRPVEGMLSTTVLAPTAADADALSTAFYAMGVEAALAYCRDHPEVSAVLMTPGDRQGAISVHTANLEDETWRPAS